MILCILGKSGAGKDTFLKYLEHAQSKQIYRRVVSYTTRPKRDKEVDGKDYNFVSLDEFIQLIEKNKIIEYRKYKTVKGYWYYGTPFIEDKDDIVNIIIVDLKGYKFIKKHFKNTFVQGIYLDTPKDIRYKRLLKRGDLLDEVNRRLEADDKDFSELDNLDFETIVLSDIGSDELIIKKLPIDFK